ncbi:MAG TPA: AraC family transcriptional regulator [Gemmatimonadales bacterium]
MTSTLAMVRAAAARGIDTAAVLKAFRVDPGTLEDPDARLPGSTVLAVWNALRAATGDPALQLAAPTALPFGAYRIIDYLVAASATVGDGVRRFARYFGLIAEEVTLSVEAEAGDHCLVLARADGGPVPPVYVDYVFAALVTRIRMRIRPDLVVAGVDLRQPAPPAAARYQEVFQAPVRFGAPADRLRFPHAAWEQPTVDGDAALAALLEEHARILAARTPTAGAGFVGVVEQAIAARLPDGASAEAVARELNVSVRTLQRRLVACGATFHEVSDAVRARLAAGYLADPVVSVSEVAFLLGFSEQSAFNRAFRRWTGESPGRWRRRAGAP